MNLSTLSTVWNWDRCACRWKRKQSWRGECDRRRKNLIVGSMTSKHVDPRTADELLPMVPMSIILKFSEAHKKKKGPKDKSASKDKKERDSENDDDSDSDSDSDGSHFVESADDEEEETGVLPDHDDWSWLQ